MYAARYFTYNTISNNSFRSAHLYGGRYGSLLTADTISSICVLDSANVASELTLIQAFVETTQGLCLPANMVEYTGGDVTYASYESSSKWYRITSGSGTITLHTSNLTDNFYIYNDGDLDLSTIAIALSGNAQVTNVYILSDTVTGLNTTNYGNFITNSFTAQADAANDINIIGTLSIVNSTNVTDLGYFYIYLGAPVYRPTYAALAYNSLTCTINGESHGVVEGTMDVTGTSPPVSPTTAQAELEQLSLFFAHVQTFLNLNTSITSTIAENGSCKGTNQNTYYSVETSASGDIDYSSVYPVDAVFILIDDGVDLTNFEFGPVSNNCKMYLLCKGSVVLHQLDLNVIVVAQGDVGFNAASIKANVFSLTGSIIGQGSVINVGAVDTYPAYTFSFAAITAYKLNNLVIHGGKYGASIIGSNVTPINSQLDDVSAELAAIQDFKTYLLSNETMPQASYDGTTDVTMTSGIWYTVTIPSFGTRTVTFDGESKTDANFYWYKTGGNLDLYYIDFRFINNAQPSNLYIICDDDIILYNSTNYGNLVAYGIIAAEPSTVYGTVTALAANETLTVSNTLTVFFGTECFMRGTKILTDRWYVPIEELKVGDLVMTHGAVHDNKGHVVGDNLAVPIRSLLKYSRKSCRSSAPIVITKNAFAPNKPFEDLYASPNHGIVDRQGKLSPISHFLNDTSIFQDPTVDLITYYHLDLGGHYVITANGVLTESWLDPKMVA
jgi:hypothetical protein